MPDELRDAVAEAIARGRKNDDHVNATLILVTVFAPEHRAALLAELLERGVIASAGANLRNGIWVPLYQVRT